MLTVALHLLAFALGAVAWTLAEYGLHRGAMHALRGKGIMSREHLEHHVRASWSFDVNHILSWIGMLLVGFGLLAPAAAALTSWSMGFTLAVGWAAGYVTYEYQHARAHLRAPRWSYHRWVARHHFHHHFGHPNANHGVSVPWWDHVFGTYERPEIVRVPRRLVIGWLVDDDGAVRREWADDYELVGRNHRDEATARDDRDRAFASVAPQS